MSRSMLPRLQAQWRACSRGIQTMQPDGEYCVNNCKRCARCRKYQTHSSEAPTEVVRWNKQHHR